MQAMKTIRCKIWKSTRAKQAALEGEYDNLQLYLQTGVDDVKFVFRK